ncbi:2938_t:CDS:1, partial [Dentiscutata heterogama]
MPYTTQNMNNRCCYLNMTLNDLLKKTIEEYGYTDKKNINKTLDKLSKEKKLKDQEKYNRYKEEKYLQNSIMQSFINTESVFSPDIIAYDL